MTRPAPIHAPDRLLDWKPAESPAACSVCGITWERKFKARLPFCRHIRPPLNPKGIVPLSREGDPVTSHLAGEHVAAASREAQCVRLLSAIEKTPGHIAAYYVGLLSIEGGWKRCSDVVGRGLAHYSGTEINPKTGRKCGRIWPGRGPA